MPKIAVIVVRDPDGPTRTVLFVDGVEVPESNVDQYDVDPGAGSTRTDWDASTTEMVGQITRDHGADAGIALTELRGIYAPEED
jgi:hypothetical protein